MATSAWKTLVKLMSNDHTLVTTMNGRTLRGGGTEEGWSREHLGFYFEIFYIIHFFYKVIIVISKEDNGYSPHHGRNEI